jgi:CP family cyanate transporter-like MFS transporter
VGQRTRLALALCACAIAARPLAVSIGPVLPDIQRDLAMGQVVSGLVGTVPVVCLGLFAPVGVMLAGRLRPRIALGIALALVVVFGAARAAAPGVQVLVLLTVGLGVGMGMAGSIPAMIIKARAPGQPALMTGMYGVGVVGGAALASVLIVPLVELGDGWRAGTLLLSLPVLLTVGVGYWLLGPDAGDVRPRVAAALPWTDAAAWRMAVMFGLQSLIYWGLVIWLAEVLVAMRWSQPAAGTMVAIFQMSSLVAVVVTGYVADRIGSRRSQLRVVSAGFTIALLGLALAPDVAAAWVVLAGSSLGAAFPLVLTLPVDFATDDRDAGNKSSLMLLVGYLVAAAGPPMIGLVRELTPALPPVFLLLGAFGLAFLVLTWWLGTPRNAGSLSLPITTD